MFDRIMKSFNRLFSTDRKKKYLKALKTRSQQIPGQLPEGMNLPPIQGKANDYTFIEDLKNDFVKSKKNYSLGVSIVVPVYNRKDILAKTLSGIINQTYPSELIETIVADDGSSDGVEELIPEYSNFMDIKYVKQEDKGYRLSKVRNLGIKAAKHDYIIILDCDMLPIPELVESYMQYLHITTKAVLIGYRRFVCTDNVSAGEIRRDINVALNLPDIVTNNPIITKKGSKGPTKDWREEIYNKTNLLKDLDYPFRAFCGGNVAFSKSLLVTTKYFDEDFNNWGGEDIEMGYRIYNNGFYFIPVKGATALHQEPEGGESSVDREGGKSITHDLLVDKCPAAHYRKQSPREEYSVPKVSIYIPAYNAEKYIKEAVDSALNQTFKDLEVVIVDDGSTDNTAKILEDTYSSNKRVTWITQNNQGISAASNKAISLCRGYLIGQLDSDDRLKPDAVEKLLPYFDNHQVGCVYACYEVIDKESEFEREGWNYKNFSRERLMCGMIIHHFRMFRKRDWRRSFGFDKNLTNAVDFDFFLKLSEVSDFVHVNDVLYDYRLHGNNTSVVNMNQQDKNTLTVINNALKRLNLHSMWEPFVPNPEKPRSITFSPVGDFGGWSISKTLFDFINELLEPGSRIIETGSGWGTGELAKNFEMYSIEHDPHFINIHHSNYINSPIVEYFDDSFPNDSGWYNSDILKKELPKDYDLILVDGPPGTIGRSGFYKHLDLFRSDVPIILDDVDRKEELNLLKMVETKTGRKAVIHKDSSLEDGEKTKHFAVLMPTEEI
jgi:glycosyltransferase involved in cell wall biosynthesis